ncbi:arsenite efflux transporter metallochaperone ArsD [Clostridium isatidis]|uniref:Transcriptional regulator n=1 Tax=Clostridium isatidis TaxID=182773 RepID=A0A343JA17_9CLOT|nr:arsenite efflux transporter metallochaperone ArsD [Clostridium isatidis]ASW42375.1 transcriptional regulator [Clostridium isatidis]NLZ33567.1 arsenite efflux transporter metallochaperone ArsD [Clostridiales bacterium]
MKKMLIFEPAMCCPTGLCGVGVDPELLRISAVLNTLKSNGIEVERFNLTNSPQEFVKNSEVNEFINKYGVDKLPVVVVDGKIELIGRYPTNEEFEKLLGVSVGLSHEKGKSEKANACGCSNEKCC